MRLVVPICVQMGSQQLMVTTDLIFLGRLGRFPLAVGTLASTLFNLLWFGIAGFGTAFDTLGSQAHGAGDALAVRNWAALAAASLSACCVPAAAVWLCGRFLASGVLSQDAATADAVGAFCAVLSLGLWPAALTLVLMLESTPPPAMQCMIFCQLFAQDAERPLGKVLVATYVCSLVTLTAWIALFLSLLSAG